MLVNRSLSERLFDNLPLGSVFVRCLIVALQLIAVYCLTEKVSPFFYQRF